MTVRHDLAPERGLARTSDIPPCAMVLLRDASPCEGFVMVAPIFTGEREPESPEGSRLPMIGDDPCDYPMM